MKKRIFIAINLPDGVRRRLKEYQGKWIDLPSDKIRWVKKDNLHITLIFIGYVSNDEMYEIINMAKQVAKNHNPFMINLENVILGPPDKTPRMFWAQGEKSQELANLQADLEEKIEQRHGARHAFRPHITLARFKQRLATIKVDEPFKAQIPVETIEIMQSDLKRTGPEYSVLESIELGL